MGETTCRFLNCCKAIPRKRSLEHKLKVKKISFHKTPSNSAIWFASFGFKNQDILLSLTFVRSTFGISTWLLFLLFSLMLSHVVKRIIQVRYLQYSWYVPLIHFAINIYTDTMMIRNKVTCVIKSQFNSWFELPMCNNGLKITYIHITIIPLEALNTIHNFHCN